MCRNLVRKGKEIRCGGLKIRRSAQTRCPCEVWYYHKNTWFLKIKLWRNLVRIQKIPARVHLTVFFCFLLWNCIFGHIDVLLVVFTAVDIFYASHCSQRNEIRQHCAMLCSLGQSIRYLSTLLKLILLVTGKESYIHQRFFMKAQLANFELGNMTCHCMSKLFTMLLT